MNAQTCPWPNCIVAVDHPDDHMDEQGNRFTDQDVLDGITGDPI